MQPGRGASQRGFTLLEIMIVVSILAIVASVGVPQYVSALRTARVGKAKHELVTISHAVDAYRATNDGQLPLTLHQVGFGGKRDPWGVPYCYLNYTDGTGDGLQWAIDAGLVDPAAVKGYSDSGGSGGGASGGTGATGGTGGTVPTMRGGSFLPFPQGPLVQTQDTGAVVTPRPAARNLATTITTALPRAVTSTEVEDLATAISTAPGFTMFTDVPVATTRRCDRFMYPLNSDYDLFSLGPNGRTTVSLGETMGQDDVIRANNGGFFGVASDY